MKHADAPLVLACGNPGRGDDAAGLLVARHLAELGMEARGHSGDGAALMELWDGRDFVILIDTVVTGGIPGTITAWDGLTAPVEGAAFRGTHAFGVAEALKLGRALGRMPAQLLIYGIEGSRFDLGSEPAAAVAAAARDLAAVIAAAANPKRSARKIS
jgi:hydrogenase maturation protease